jgi:hypothetical protein
VRTLSSVWQNETTQENQKQNTPNEIETPETENNTKGETQKQKQTNETKGRPRDLWPHLLLEQTRLELHQSPAAALACAWLLAMWCEELSAALSIYMRLGF